MQVSLASLSCEKQPDTPKLDKEAAQFVGIWAVSSDNPDKKFAYWVFYDDGTAKKIISPYDYSSNWDWKDGGTGKWTYDKDTKILATTVDLFQVQITMFSKEEWSAIGTDGKYHYTGKVFSKNEEDRLYLLLIGTKWIGSKYGEITIGSSLSAYLGKNSTIYDNALWFSTPPGIKEAENNYWTNLFITSYDDELHFSLTRRYFGTAYGREQYFSAIGDANYKVTKFELTNPLSPSSCRLEFNVTVTEEKQGDKLIIKSTRKYEDTYKIVF